MTIPRGTHFENKAQEYLTYKGYRVLHRNWRTRFGEIDIIAQDARHICFVEVKARNPKSFAEGAYAVHQAKQKKIRKTALAYSSQHPDAAYRFDVLEITASESWIQYNLIKNAFDMDG